jgi:hypothetical protein
MMKSMSGHRRCVDASHIPLSAPTVNRCIAVEHLSPTPRERHADAVIVSRNRSEIARDEEKVVIRFAAPEK